MFLHLMQMTHYAVPRATESTHFFPVENITGAPDVHCNYIMLCVD